MRALRLVWDVTTAELFSKGVQAEVITMRGGQGCHRLALPENLLVSNKTIPVTKLQYNTWMRSAAWDRGLPACAEPDPDSLGVSWANQWLVTTPGTGSDTWHVTCIGVHHVPSQLHLRDIGRRIFIMNWSETLIRLGVEIGSGCFLFAPYLLFHFVSFPALRVL